MGGQAVKKGRFTVTETVKTVALPSIREERSPAPNTRTFKRGRFKVCLTCMCDATSTKHSDDEDVSVLLQDAQPQPAASKPPRSGSNGDLWTLQCSKAAADARPMRDQGSDSCHSEPRSSWDSAGSESTWTSSPVSTPLGAPAKTPVVARRVVRFSDVDTPLDTGTPCVPPSPPPSPLSACGLADPAAVPGQQAPAACTNFGWGGMGKSVSELPRAVTKSYRRGRFVVEEGLLRTDVGTGCGQPDSTVLLARATSVPEGGSAGAQAACNAVGLPFAASASLAFRTPQPAVAVVLAHSADSCTLLGSDCDAVVTGQQAFMEQSSNKHAPVWGVAVTSAQLTELNSGPVERRHHTVSYSRRGRFLVQTYF